MHYYQLKKITTSLKQPREVKEKTGEKRENPGKKHKKNYLINTE